MHHSLDAASAAEHPTYRSWTPTQHTSSSAVETISLKEGFELVLSRIEGTDHCQFHYQEPNDVFGIGFHLKGGAKFDLEGKRFETLPLDAWAVAAPRGSASVFHLPNEGFHTASLRFVPHVLKELLKRHCQSESLLDEMARLASSDVAGSKLAPLSPAAAEVVEAMFTTPYRGAARTLFLESCSLQLLAAQIEAIAEQKQTQAQRRQCETYLTEARVWLDSHLSDPPSIIKLARIVGVNECKLKRRFKEAYGMTIFAYVRKKKNGACSIAPAGRSRRRSRR